MGGTIYRIFFVLLCGILLLPGVFAQEGTASPEVEPPDTSVLEAVEDSTASISTSVEKALEKAVEENPVIQTVEDAGEVRMGLWIRLGIAFGVVILQIFIIWLVWQLFKVFARRLVDYGKTRIKPLKIKKLKLLDTPQILNMLLFFLRLLKYLVTFFQLFITVPIVFSLFPATEKLASILFGYILTPFKNILFGTIAYIPNLITIGVIVFVTRYVIRGLKFFSTQIQREKLAIPGFYPDWASPTFNILRVLLWAFTVAIIYPYLPGSESRIFQGVSVFVGIIFSLGSSSAIGNLVAGLVVTYMRPFKIGDRIQIQGNTGILVEKTLMVVRIKTHKNEYITFPNLQVLSASIINYNTSSDEDEEGLVLYAEITFGYGTPWKLVHEILIEAASKTEHVLQSPRPFVLQTALDDFYCHYQINCFTKEIDRIPSIYSELFQNIQDGFHAQGLDMTAPHFRINLPPESAMYTPPEDLKSVAAAVKRTGKKKTDTKKGSTDLR
ncbi:MAG: mechanosensitive ion channel family protein [Treponema sp.]|jgi:small-conductance mechanosensitive channel|nr:mechanosensitive ion channel family protein [Treponema sp.]